MLTVSLWHSHYFKIPVKPTTSFFWSAKKELDDSAVLNYLIGWLIQPAHWLLVCLSGILTWENWRLLSNSEKRAPAVSPSCRIEEKTRVTLILNFAKTSKSLSISFSVILRPFVSYLTCVICCHLRSGRGVVLVLLTVLHESGVNLISWMSRVAIPASVQLVHRSFVSVVCLLLFFSPCACVYTCMCEWVLIAERFLSEGCISWMRE